MIEAHVLTARMKQLRTKKHLKEAPELVEYILHQVVKVGGAPGPRVSGSREIPIPLNARAMEDANNLYAQLVNWSISHARALSILPPSLALGWSRRDENCDGFPSWATTADAAALTRDIADWLILGADKLQGPPFTDTYHDDIHAIFGPLHGRYPRAPRRQTTSRETCPVCDRDTVIVNFTDQDDNATVACTYCGHVIPPTAYERYLEVVLIAAAVEHEERDWLSIDEAAELGEVSRGQVRRYIRDGLKVYGRPLGEYLNRDEFLTARRRAIIANDATRLRSLQ